MTEPLPGYAEGWHGTGGPTIPARHRYPPDCPVPIKLTVPLAVAKANAVRAFAYAAVIFGAVGLALGLALAGWLA